MVKIIALQNTAQSTAQTAQNAAQLLEVELNIIKVITRQPDLSQRKIAEEIGETYSSVRYHMDKMLNAGVLTKEKSGKNKMDATCTIQDSIHVFNLVHKYVSRILGTYQIKLYLKETFITKIIT